MDRQVTGNDVLLATGSRGGFHLCHLSDAPVGCKALRIPIPTSVCLTLDERKQHTKANTSRNHTTLSQLLVRSCTCSILIISVFLGQVECELLSPRGKELYASILNGSVARSCPSLPDASLLFVRRRRRRRPGDEWLTRWMHIAQVARCYAFNDDGYRKAEVAREWQAFIKKFLPTPCAHEHDVDV